MFREKGFSRVSINQIADKAGVSQVTIYNHFGDKYHLVEAAVMRISEEKIDEYRSILLGDGPWIERLRTVIVDKKRYCVTIGGSTWRLSIANTRIWSTRYATYS